MRSLVATLVATILLVAACGPLDGGPTPAPGDTPSPPGETPAIDPVTPTPAEPSPAATPVAGCLEGDTFVEEGVVPLDEPGVGDSREIAELRWEAHEGCERFVIDLAGEDGEPANLVGAVRAEVLRDLGIVRVSLVHVERVNPDAVDVIVDGPLARAAHAVTAPDGWIYVDLHTAAAAEAHVSVLEDPARVVVDLRASGGPVPQPPATSDLVVILAPASGDASWPLEVTGYARTFEANVVIRIEQQGEEVSEDSTTATAWADAWGEYAFTIEDGRSGRIQLHVGEYSARDGTWEGAMVELEMQP